MKSLCICLFRRRFLSNRKPLLISTIIIGILTAVPGSDGLTARRNRGIDMCEPIDIPMCQSMKYNMTRMPNHLHHSTIENARLAIEPYGELIKQNCSEDLLFFLCAMFAPICTPMFQMEAIPPCRSVCERSRLGCEPLMNEHKIAWPEALNCDRLPEYEKGVCVSQDAIVSEMPEIAPDTEDPVIPVPTVPVPPPPMPECICKKARRPNKKLYKKGRFDYAISAVVNNMRTVDFTNSVTQLTVTGVLKAGKVDIVPDQRLDIWTNSSCVCPKLSINKEYLIIGNEDVATNRLVFVDSSLVARWSPKWEKKVKKWNKTKSKKRRKGRCKKVNSDGGSSKKCRRRNRRKNKTPKKDNSVARRRHRNKSKNNPNSTRSTQTNKPIPARPISNSSGQVIH